MRFANGFHNIAAAVVALAAAGSAQAVVVYSGIVNIAVPNNIDGLYVNVVTGSTYAGSGFPATSGPGANYDFNLFAATTWSAFSPGSLGQALPTPVPATSKGYVAATTTTGVLNLASGTVIGGASIFNTGTPTAAAIATGSAAYFGFRFRNENAVADPADDTVHFGWARVTLTNGVPGTLIDYAFESTPLTSITVGVVPEPGSVLLMGAGLAGMLALVRRRRS